MQSLHQAFYNDLTQAQQHTASGHHEVAEHVVRIRQRNGFGKEQKTPENEKTRPMDLATVSRSPGMKRCEKSVRKKG